MPAYESILKQYEGKILDEFTKVVGCHRKAAIETQNNRKPTSVT